MLQDLPDRFRTRPEARFRQLNLPPPQALRCVIDTLRKGDPLIVLTAPEGAERAALLGGIAEQGGAGRRVVRRSGLKDRSSLVHCLSLAGLPNPGRGPAFLRRLTKHSSDDWLIIVEHGELLCCEALEWLGDLTRTGEGRRQMVLCGAPLLLARISGPGCAHIWRRVRVSVSVSCEAAQDETRSDAARLSAQIVREEARLEAKKRLLAALHDREEPV